MGERLIRHPLIAIALALLTLSAAGAAWAGCNACTPPPPTCNCVPPSPPPPPSPPCCHQINFPGVNVSIGATVVASANAQSFASSGAAAGSNTVVFGGGGGGMWSMGEGAVGVIQGLNVEGMAIPTREAFEAERTKIRIVVIQAVCIDDREVPHPASQVTPDREVDEHYEGELYRCIAGSHMQATLADYHGQISFEHGEIINCAKGEALYRFGDGKVLCKAQAPARDCNERSLLRRYGAGVKIVKMISVERYVAYREEVSKSAQVTTFNMTIDGGVGGVVH